MILNSIGEDKMLNSKLESAIEKAWNDRETISPETKGETRLAIEQTLEALDSGAGATGGSPALVLGCWADILTSWHRLNRHLLNHLAAY